MESIETFADVFQKSWKEKNRNSLDQLLKELPGYLKNTSLTDADQILEMLMRGQNGLFQCMRKILDTPKNWSGSDTFLKESFEALQSIMDYSQQYYESYILETRNLCFYCMKTKCWYYSRKTATETLKKLIESYTNYDMQLDEIVEYFIDSYSRRYSKKDGCIFYIVLGAIGKHCPKLRSINQHINAIFIQLLKDLLSQYDPDSLRQPEELKIYLECYLELFVNFVPLKGDRSKSEPYLKKLYGIILKICEPRKAQKSYRNIAIQILSCNIKHFEAFVFEDHQKWYTLFNVILEDVETKVILSAVRNFYNIVAVHLVKEYNQDVFWYFRNKFIVTLEYHEELTPRKLQMIVNGLGEFAVTYPKYEPAESHNVFQMIAVRALHIIEKIDNDFETIANYLQTLSQIVRYSSNTTFHQVGILTELSVRFIKGFPEIKKHSQNRTIKALNASFVNVSCLEKHLQREFFNSVLSEGILWSCSHTLYVDKQLQKELESIPKKQICYKDYLPFWHSLFKIDIQEKTVNLTLQLFDDFVSVLMMYITKLNFNVVAQDDESSSNTLMCLKAENETDFWFFINIVDLYVEVFEQVDSNLLPNSLEKLTIFFINYSYKYPLVSGFYKIIKVCLKRSDDLIDHEYAFSTDVKELISQYLSDILKLISGFSEELQFSCIGLIFDTPLFLIKNLINEMLPIFEIAFNVGLSNFPLADSALKTLEDWDRNPIIEISNTFLKNILCYMEPYLSTNESSSKAIQSNTKLEKTDENEIYDSEVSLEDLQRKILLFHGSLDPTILFDFIHERSTKTNASWNKKDLLQYELLFPDMRLEIHMDKFLTRIIELTKSGDQKIKVCACELLHSMITIILGKKLMDQCFNKDLCLALLRLGCDADDGIKNLFHPLTLQLTHYLSSSLMKEPRIPQIFVDSLFEGLSEEFNTTLRDHCGLYLKEFMQWSIKQSVDHDLTKDPNVLSVIRKINTLALYPSNKKRLAAVSAFNNMYTILRENLSIVQTYWLEFLYVFIKCLEEYDNMQVVSAIDHVEKVITHYKNIFNAKNRHRRKPPGFADETLGGALIWSFAHCDSLDAKCRNKCMKLFENLLPLVNHSEAVKHELEKKAHDIVSKNYELKFDFDSISIHNGQDFLKNLDFQIWIMKKDFISSKCLFNCDDISVNVDAFQNYFSKFVKVIVNQDPLILDDIDADQLVETEKLVNLTNEIILKILEFISTVLDTQENHDAIVPWNDDLYTLIVRCILSPQKIGLTAKSLQVSDEYYIRLESFLTLIMNKTSMSMKKFVNVFMAEANEHFLYFAEIHDIIEFSDDMSERIYTLKLFVKGLCIVKKSKFFDFEKEKNFTSNYWQSKTDEIFKSLKIRMMDNDVCNKLNEHVKVYLNELMTLYFETYQPETVRQLINLIATNGPLETSTGIKISHGEYFLDTFREPILSCMLKNVLETMVILDEFHSQYPHIVFCMLEELLMFALRNKTIGSEVLAEEVLKRCGKLKSLVNNLENRKIKLFSMNHVAVKLMKKPTEIFNNVECYKDMYLWLAGEFSQAKDLEKKATLLQHFIICLADEMTNSESGFIVLPANLREMDDEDWLKTMKTNEVQRFHAATLFGVLLKSLLATKSLLVYRSAVSFSAGVCKFLYKEGLRKYLDPYFATISDQFAVKSLKVCYQIFMDLNIDVQRLDVLQSFLLPSLESNKNSVVVKFYEQFGEEMIEYIKQDIDRSSHYHDNDRKKLIVTKIACYNIFELLFARFDIKFANVQDQKSETDKTLSSFLVEESVKLRFYSTAKDDEKEITRLMHCAALNCCISVVSLKKEEKFYKFIFMEDRKKEQLLWDRIVDSQKIYGRLPTTGSDLLKDRRKLINIRSGFDKQHSACQEFAVSYMHRRDLSQLSFVEDIHAYDLNDVAVSSEPCKKLDGDCRLDLNFENDDINEHECMSMISGVLIHIFNSGVILLPEPNESSAELPVFLKHFRNGLVSNQSNVILFLLKVICNTKEIFLSYFEHMFVSVAKALIRYLSSNRNRMNHVIRDILFMIIESKYVPPQSASSEAAATQSLLNCLFLKAYDDYANIQKYNLELIESLCTLWSQNLLDWPSNVNTLLSSNVGSENIDHSSIGFNILLILLRTNTYDARNQIARQVFLKDIIIKTALKTPADYVIANATTTEMSFEILGMLLRFSDDPELEEQLAPRILTALGASNQHSIERSARYACALYMGWKSESENCTNLLSKFACPRIVLFSFSDACFCLEVYLLRLNSRQIDPEKLTTELDTQVGLKQILSARLLSCLGPALRILERMVALLPESTIRYYLEYVAKGYCSPALCLLEHRLLAYKCLGEAYARYPDSPSAGLWLAQLVRGLEDPNDEVQDQLVDFWRSRLQFPETCCERLLKLLSMYATDLKDGFARLLCLLMLELTNKSPDADRSMFRPLIEQCSFREWNPTAGENSIRRLRKLGSMVPLFAPSLILATQRLEHRMLASGTLSTAEMGNSFVGSLRIRATGELVFEPTLSAASQSERSQTRIPDPSQNRLSKRLTQGTKISVHSIGRHRSKKEEKYDYHDQLKKEKESRLNSCKFYRKYRIGDFPDVELTHSSFVLSLRQLMMRDWMFCKDFTVGLVCSLIDRLKNSDKYSTLMKGISSTFEKVVETEEERNNFAPAALEIAQHAGDIELKASNVGRICKNMQLNALGIVLLEESSIRESGKERQEREDEPPLKKMRRGTGQGNWIELASLYKSIGYTDVVGSIFRHADSFSRDVKAGTLAQIASDWTTACHLYKKAHEVIFDLEQDYCLDSMFECMRELSNWGDINNVIEKILKEDYKAVWSHRRKNILLPWIFEAQLHKALEDYTANRKLEPKNKSFVENVTEWIHCGDLVEVKSNFGQELAVLLLCSGQKSEETSRFCMNTNLNRIREQWIRLSPIEENARLRILTKLRGMNNIETYINTVKADDIEESTISLIKCWEKHLPSINDDLVSWNMHMSYRLTFAKLLHEKVDNNFSDDSLVGELLITRIKQRLRICEMAMKNKNNVVAKKHSSRIEQLLHDLSEIVEIAGTLEFAKLHYDFMLTASKYKLLCGMNESNASKKCDYYVQSWKIANDLLDDENTTTSIKIRAKHHLFDLTLSIQELMDSIALASAFMSDAYVTSNINSIGLPTFADNLVKFSLNCLKSVWDMGSRKEMAESYTKFGKYCYSLICEDKDNVWDDFTDEFITSILSAMSFGSVEAAHYFPCLLKYDYYYTERSKQIFLSRSANVPTWLFLFWQAQIVTHLDKPLAELLIPIMKKLVRDYPNGVVYDFRQMYISLSQKLQADPDIRYMHESLFADPKLENFIEAMHFVCQPELYLSHNLARLKDSKENYEKGMESLIEKVYGSQCEEQGPLYKMAIDKYRLQLEKLKQLDFESAKRSIDKLNEELHSAMKRRIADGKYQALQLKDYSPYLSHFTEKDLEIEIPGQYCKREKPLLRYHTKISKFDRYVRVMDSKRNPIKINMIGNDAQSYGFLVKFGEDLRQDQRLQQIFNIVNETFDSDMICNRRYLSINTYHVVPLSTSLGLIEWVDETRSLREFVEFSMEDKEILNVVTKEYQSWIDKAAKPGKNSYKEALLKYDRKTVISKLKEFIHHFDWDCLRKTFTIISPNLECFVSLRHNFITSYAAMCPVHWITGVGDRHLENMLIEVKSGKCYGIDFGAAFGAGIDQAVPELVPFRLTPQILGLLKPFDERALFGVTMTHVLRALRNRRDLILAYFDVFIHEPLNWSKNRSEKSREDSDHASNIKWSAEKKIKTVEKKLNGMDPPTIMMEELANIHGNKSESEYVFRYVDVIHGTDQNTMSFRSTLRNRKLTPEEQTKCLLEHAMDLNVLGRMYAGWSPFV